MSQTNEWQNQTGQRPADEGGWLSREKGSALVLIAATVLAFYIAPS